MESPAPIPAQDLAQEQLTVTWLGHSSLLVQMHGMNVLIDPVFSQRTSPVRFAGPKRFSAPPIDAEHMPEIDLLLLSHDHYDHMDMETILALDDKVGQYVVPLGLENHLARWGIDGDRVQTMAWWEQLEIDGLTIGCTPAQHFSGRGLNDRFETLGPPGFSKMNIIRSSKAATRDTAPTFRRSTRSMAPLTWSCSTVRNTACAGRRFTCFRSSLTQRRRSCTPRM